MTANPAMTPPLKGLEVEETGWVELEAKPLSMSITPCWTHSPNEHPFKVSPLEPKIVCNVACLKLHVAVFVELSTAPQAISRVPVRPSIAPVRLETGTPPQNEVPSRQLHWRLEQVQSALLSVPSCWVHESASQ